MSEELKPCMRCAGVACYDETESTPFYWVVCRACGFEGETFTTREGAAEWWNTRAPDPSVAELERAKIVAWLRIEQECAKHAANQYPEFVAYWTGFAEACGDKAFRIERGEHAQEQEGGA